MQSSPSKQPYREAVGGFSNWILSTAKLKCVIRVTFPRRPCLKKELFCPNVKRLGGSRHYQISDRCDFVLHEEGWLS